MQETARTRYLILGLLAEGPCSGYDIRRITLGRFGFFWSESYGQIYPCLRRMEAEGLIIGRTGRQRGKVVWAITGPGREALVEWLCAEAQPETARFEAILKYYFSWAMPPESRKTLLEAFRDRQAGKLAELEAFRAELLAAPDPHGNHGLALDTIELGIATYAAWKAWAEGRLGARPRAREEG